MDVLARPESAGRNCVGQQFIDGKVAYPDNELDVSSAFRDAKAVFAELLEHESPLDDFGTRLKN
jgi:hypothetical protein